MSAGAGMPGYIYGTTDVSASPVSLEELRNLEAAVGWSEEDAMWLKEAAKTLVPHAEAMVDSWRAEIARQPYLIASFLDPQGKPDDAYKAAVKRRFVQWVSDVCLRPHDQEWLNYQEEIGLRHTPAKKNKTDGRHTPPVVPMRYLIGFSSVVILSVRGFLAKDDRPEAELIRMQEAWTRAVLLSITLWTRAYTVNGLW
jgi:Protoglobin